jgi:hypothetical protein
MTEAPALSFRIGTPVPGPNHAAVLCSYEMLLQRAADCLPVTVPATEGQLFFESWEVTRAALMARMASTLRHLGYLAPSYSRLDGAALTRTLLDHVIYFAWLSADPAGRLPRFLRSSFGRALKKHNRMAEHGHTDFLTAELRGRYNEYIRDHPDRMPTWLTELAAEADERWVVEVRGGMPSQMQIPSLAELYVYVYDYFANLDHPSVTALQAFVHTASDPPTISVDGEIERDLETDLRPYWLGAWSMCWALLVSSLASGRPTRGPLQETLRQVRVLREYDRHGLLVVTQDENGVRVAAVADIDERIAEIVKARGEQEDAAHTG